MLGMTGDQVFELIEDTGGMLFMLAVAVIMYLMFKD
jgi:hypothetical protein